MPGFVLDSYALIVYFRDEAGADKIESLQREAAAGNEPLHMTEVNYAEVKYIIIRKNGLPAWNSAAASLISLPIAFHAVTRELAEVAGDFKSRYRISLADAFAAALALILKAELVSGDSEFKQLRREVKVSWL